MIIVICIFELQIIYAKFDILNRLLFCVFAHCTQKSINFQKYKYFTLNVYARNFFQVKLAKIKFRSALSYEQILDL